MLTTTSNAQPEYLVLQFSYTTAEVEASRFFGETSNPFYFTTPQSPAERHPVIFTVIDGEARIVKDESPPGARLPDPASGLFRLANVSTLAKAPA